MDPKEIRERLGLAEDASDAEVQQAVKELNEAVGSTAGDGSNVVPGTTVTPAGTGQPTPEAPVTPEGATAEDDPNNVARAAGAAQVTIPAGMRLIDEATLESLRVGASAGLEVKQQTEKQRRESLVSAAVGDGRIAPAAREHWLNALETADKHGDTATAAALESMPKWLIPVDMRELGHGGQGPEGQASASGGFTDDDVANWSSGLFSEVREQRERDAARASGQSMGRQRIVADGSYRR